MVKVRGVELKLREVGVVRRRWRGEVFERLYLFEDGWRYIVKKVEISWEGIFGIVNFKSGCCVK